MSGTPSTEHGDPTGHGPEDQQASPSTRTRQAFPWQLGASAVVWILLGGLLIASALGATSTTSEADQGSIDQIQSQLGQSAVAASPGNGQHPTLYLLLGLVTLLMALMLLIGQSWARHVLTVLGLLAVVLFAFGGRWEAIVAFVLLAVGAILLLNRPVQRYLNQ